MTGVPRTSSTCGPRSVPRKLHGHARVAACTFAQISHRPSQRNAPTPQVCPTCASGRLLASTNIPQESKKIYATDLAVLQIVSVWGIARAPDKTNGPGPRFVYPAPMGMRQTRLPYLITYHLFGAAFGLTSDHARHELHGPQTILAAHRTKVSTSEWITLPSLIPRPRFFVRGRAT
jgi:hypothetical protein